MMVMDTSTNGVAGRLMLMVSGGVALLALLGGIYSLGQSTNSVESKLDRNCRVLAAVQANTRFLILSHSSHADAESLRRIFEAAGIEACG